MRLAITLCFLVFTNLVYSGIPKIHFELQKQIDKSSEHSVFPVYILFNEYLKLADFTDIGYDTPKKDRRQIVIKRLKSFSQNSQYNVRNFLQQKKSRGVIEDYEVLWVTNSIRMNANPEVLNELALFGNVKMICYDPAPPASMLLDFQPAATPFNLMLHAQNPVNVPQPGIILIRADQVWELGNKGRNVVVGISDNGFYWRHPDLKNGIWENLGEDANQNGMTILIQSGTTSTYDFADINGIDDDGNGKVDDLIGWDFSNNSYDIGNDFHGSATLGQVIGDGTGGTATGVSPEAKTILLRNAGGESQQWAAFQYALEVGAEIITSSLSWKWHFIPKPNYSQMRLLTDVSLAAGVIHTNSTSNDGGNFNLAPVPLNISTAGNCPSPWHHPDQLRVGNQSAVIGVGNVDAIQDLIVSNSPYGPFTWGNWNLWGNYSYPVDTNHRDYPYSRTSPVEIPDSMGLLKPDVTAPGDATISTFVSQGTGYGAFLGTSSATPHTAGCIALMLSNNPEMLPEDIDQVLQLTAIEKGAPGKDPRYGSGRIDALAATTSPKFTLEGINGGSNMIISRTLNANDSAKELAGLKIFTDVNPKIGSLRTTRFLTNGTADSTHILSFDLYWDKDGNDHINTGDILLRSIPFAPAFLLFDSLKFKYTNKNRTIIVAARTTAEAAGKTVNLQLIDTNDVTAYYTTKPFAVNFPFGIITKVANHNSTSELSYFLAQNYPNPFNPGTILNYTIARDGFVKLKVFNALGNEIAILVNGFKTKGNYNVEFDANEFGNLAAGVYFYKLESSDYNMVKKMILIK